MFVKWVILIQIWFHQFLWVLWGKKKIWGKTHFEIFGPTGCDLSTSSPKSSNSNILVSAHPIGKLKIVLEILRSREDMVKNPFLYFECFTSGNPCDSSTSPRANFWFGTSEKFSKHGFSFFHPNLPFSLESQFRWHIGWLIYKAPHLASNTHLEIEVENFLRHEEELVENPYLANFSFNFRFHAENSWPNFWKLHISHSYRRPEAWSNSISKTKNPSRGI